MNKLDLPETLDVLRKATRRFKKKADLLAVARQDAQQFQAEIEKIGEPAYKDTDAFLKLATLERQLAACTKTIAVLEDEVAQLAEDTGTHATVPAAAIAQRVLQSGYDRRLETVFSAMRPYFSDDAAARFHAQQSDAVAAAYRVIARWANIENELRRYSEPARLLSINSDLGEILEEATKPSPNVQKFMPFDPAKPTVQVEPEAEVQTNQSAAQTTQLRERILANVFEKWRHYGATMDQLVVFAEHVDDFERSPEQIAEDLDLFCTRYSHHCDNTLLRSWAAFEHVPGWEEHVFSPGQ